MVMKALKTVNVKVNFLHQQIKYLAPRLQIFLLNALIHSHFDYGCTSWFHLLSKNQKHRLHVAQNKCISLCLCLPPNPHIGAIHLRKIIWSPVARRVETYISTSVFKYWNRTVPSYISTTLKLSYDRYNTIKVYRKWHWIYPYEKIFSWTKNLDYNRYYEYKTYGFKHALKKNILSKLCG